MQTKCKHLVKLVTLTDKRQFQTTSIRFMKLLKIIGTKLLGTKVFGNKSICQTQ